MAGEIELTLFFIGGAILLLLVTACGWYVAIQKGRHPVEGIIFGFLMGPLGLILVACLPTQEPEPMVQSLAGRRC